MITFNELLEITKSEKISIHVSNEEQATTLLKALDKNGYEWSCGGKLTFDTHYKTYKENTCYDFRQKKKFVIVHWFGIKKRVIQSSSSATLFIIKKTIQKQKVFIHQRKRLKKSKFIF